MAQKEFDIYQTSQGVTAVTNVVQRQILAALQDGPMQLPELVELTGKAKPTLSGVHMKELLNRELVAEEPHPSDSRRKIFRLEARPLGSSGVPVEQLRDAVRQYAGATVRDPVDGYFQVLAAAPASAGAGVLRAQAKALGARFASRLAATDVRSFAAALARFVEEEGLAEHLQIDFESLTFRCRPGTAASSVAAPRMGLLIAGFAEGAAEAQGIPGVAFSSDADGEAFVLHPTE